MELVRPDHSHLPEYRAALKTGWSPNNLRAEAAAEQLESIGADPDAFLRSMDDQSAQGGPVKLPDGSTVPRLPSLRRWIWDDGFCGTVGLRWQPGTHALPPHCAGHVGYAVVPWRRREGLATNALKAILPTARAKGLAYLDITVDPDNTASRGVVLKAGAIFIGEVTHPATIGGGVAYLYRLNT